MSSSIYRSILVNIQKDYDYFEIDDADREKFCNMIYDESFKNTSVWLNQKRYFVGSKGTFEYLCIDEPTFYPFKDKEDVEAEENSSGGRMLAFQTVGAAGERLCGDAILTHSGYNSNDTIVDFFNLKSDLFRYNEGKLLWHDIHLKETVKPHSIEDYLMLFSATPDFIGLDKSIEGFDSDTYVSKIDVIKRENLFRSVVEVKSSVLNPMESCSVLSILLSTTCVFEQDMFYNLKDAYKSPEDAFRAVDQHVKGSIAYYYEDQQKLAKDKKVSLQIINPRVHNSILDQAKKKIAAEVYDPKYEIRCVTSKFWCQFKIPREDAVNFVTAAKKNRVFKKSGGRRKVECFDNSRSTDIKQYIFNTKAATCKGLFKTVKPTKGNSNTEDIYSKIDAALRKSAEVLFVPNAGNFKTAYTTKDARDIRDIRLNSKDKAGYIHQLLREMVGSLNLVSDTTTAMTGYLVMPSLYDIASNSEDPVFELHSLLAFKFLVPVELLLKFRTEVVSDMLYKNRCLVKGSLKLSESASDEVETYSKKLSKKERSHIDVFVRKRTAINIIADDDNNVKRERLTTEGGDAS